MNVSTSSLKAGSGESPIRARKLALGGSETLPLPWVGAWGALAALTATLVTLRWSAWGWVGLVTAGAFGLLPMALAAVPTRRPAALPSEPRPATKALPFAPRPAQVHPLASPPPAPRPQTVPGSAVRPAAVVATTPAPTQTLPPRRAPGPVAGARAAANAGSAPQFQLLVRMLDDIDQLEAAMSHPSGMALPGRAPGISSVRARGNCADCELPFEGNEEVSAMCRDCGGGLCTECAADATLNGHRDSCDLCWALETGMRSPRPSSRPPAPAVSASANGGPGPYRSLRPVLGPGYGPVQP